MVAHSAAAALIGGFKAAGGGGALRGTFVLGSNWGGTAVTGFSNPESQLVNLAADNSSAATWYNLGTPGSRGTSNNNIDANQLAQSGGWGGWQWSSTLTNGADYVIDLYFADFTSTGSGQRTFQCHIQDTGTDVDGNTEASGIAMDIYNEAGGSGRIIRTHEFTAAGTAFNIQIRPFVGDGFLNAFALYQKA